MGWRWDEDEDGEVERQCENSLFSPLSHTVSVNRSRLTAAKASRSSGVKGRIFIRAGGGKRMEREARLSESARGRPNWGRLSAAPALKGPILRVHGEAGPGGLAVSELSAAHRPCACPPAAREKQKRLVEGASTTLFSLARFSAHIGWRPLGHRTQATHTHTHAQHTHTHTHTQTHTHAARPRALTLLRRRSFRANALLSVFARRAGRRRSALAHSSRERRLSGP